MRLRDRMGLELLTDLGNFYEFCKGTKDFIGFICLEGLTTDLIHSYKERIGLKEFDLFDKIYDQLFN